MTTLTETAYYTRRTLLFGVVALLLFIILKISLNILGDAWRSLHPPKPPPPNFAFGPLPKLTFPEQKDLPKLTFRLETIQGGLPNMPTVGKVYFIPKGTPSLLGLERANQKAQKMGFGGDPEKIDAVTYRWTNQENPSTTLEMDINNGDFHLRYPYETDQGLLAKKNLPTNEQAAQEAKNFLSSNDLLASDLSEGTAEISYLRFTPPSLVPAIALSEADFVRVNLFRSDLDGIKILPPNPKESLISFLFSGSRESGKRIIEINYHYSPIERESLGTYPLKNISVTWQELQAGQGYIAYLGQNQDGKITIRQVYLAYYEPKNSQNFLQPVYVFEGDKNFFGYVPAIESKSKE